MLMTLKRDWEVTDGKTGKKTILPKGTYAVERVVNPLGYQNADWLVQKGTLIGATELSWRQWQNTETVDWGDAEVVITE